MPTIYMGVCGICKETAICCPLDFVVSDVVCDTIDYEMHKYLGQIIDFLKVLVFPGESIDRSPNL